MINRRPGWLLVNCPIRRALAWSGYILGVVLTPGLGRRLFWDQPCENGGVPASPVIDETLGQAELGAGTGTGDVR